MTANYPGLVSSSNMENKRHRVSKGQLKMDNPKKLATHGTQDEEKTKQKHNTIFVVYHYIRKQDTIHPKKLRQRQSNIVFMRKLQRTSQHGTQNVKTHNRTTQNTKKMNETTTTKTTEGEIRSSQMVSSSCLL